MEHNEHEFDEIKSSEKSGIGRKILASFSDKNGYDEMQMQKRDRIGRRVFTVSSWTMFLVVGLSVHPRIGDFAIIRWLGEPLHMALTIIGIFFVALIVNFICLTKAGALVPFRKKTGVHIGLAIGGFATGMFFTETIYSFVFAVVVWLTILIFYILAKMRDKKKNAGKECEEDTR